MALLPKPPTLSFQPGDKVMHMLAFFVLGAIATAGWRTSTRLPIFASLAVLGGAIEVFQAIPFLHRDPEWLDWFADMSAAAVAILVVRTILPRQ